MSLSRFQQGVLTLTFLVSLQFMQHSALSQSTAASRGQHPILLTRYTLLAKPDSTVGSGSSSYVVSPNHKVIALLCRTATGKPFVRVCRAGEATKDDAVYDEIIFASLRYSPDQKHYAYLAVQDGQSFLVVDGKEGEKEASYVSNSQSITPKINTTNTPNDHAYRDLLAFSSDSQSLIYVRTSQRGDCVVRRWLTGREERGQVYPWIAIAALDLSGQHIAFRASSGLDRYALFVDGKQISETSPSAHLYFNRKGDMLVCGEHIYSIAGDGAKAIGSCAPFVQFSPDGERSAWIGSSRSSNEAVLVIDSRPVSFKADSIKALFWSPQQQWRALITRFGKTYLVTEAGKEQELEGFWGAAFANADGVLFAWAVRHFDQAILMRETGASKPYNEIRRAFYSEDGTMAAFLARNNDGMVVLTDKGEFPLAGLSPYYVAFTPDHKHLITVCSPVQTMERHSQVFVVDGSIATDLKTGAKEFALARHSPDEPDWVFTAPNVLSGIGYDRGEGWIYIEKTLLFDHETTATTGQFDRRDYRVIEADYAQIASALKSGNAQEVSQVVAAFYEPTVTQIGTTPTNPSHATAHDRITRRWSLFMENNRLLDLVVTSLQVQNDQAVAHIFYTYQDSRGKVQSATSSDLWGKTAAGWKIKAGRS